jgi:hypothetical protein
MSHSGVHISLRALNMVMQVISEQLRLRYSRSGGGRFAEVTREKNKGNIADFFTIAKTWDMADFERRVST